MGDDETVSGWIQELKRGDSLAAERIWARYIARVRGQARRRLGAARKGSADEDDLALSAMNALYQGAREGRFRRLEDRDDLWQILAMLTARKATDLLRREQRRREVGESAVAGLADGSRVAIDVPDERFLDALSITCDERLQRLEPKLRDVALLKLQGFTNEEIAGRRNRSVSTIERYLQLIRLRWSA